MRHRLTTYCLLMLICTSAPAPGQLMPNLGGQRVGISALQFLKIGAGARGVGMGESFVAVVNDASALYYNPAGAVECAGNQVLFSHTAYVADIAHEFLGVVYHLSAQDALGLSVTALHMEDMEITTETQPFGTGRYFTFGDVAVGATYARKMTDQFSFGATVKYVEETLDVLKMRAFLVDLGTLYWTGLGSTRFAVAITNFGGEVSPEGSATTFDGTRMEDFDSFSPPIDFKLGFALDPISTEDHLLTASLQLNHPSDNSEHVRIGVEYTWGQIFSIRGGVKRTFRQPLFGEDGSSEESYALGTGVRVGLGVTTVIFDYAFAQFGRLGEVHRVSLALTF